MTWWAWLLVSWPVVSIAVALVLGRAVGIADRNEDDLRLPELADAEIVAFLDSAAVPSVAAPVGSRPTAA